MVSLSSRGKSWEWCLFLREDNPKQFCLFERLILTRILSLQKVNSEKASYFFSKSKSWEEFLSLQEINSDKSFSLFKRIILRSIPLSSKKQSWVRFYSYRYENAEKDFFLFETILRRLSVSHLSHSTHNLLWLVLGSFKTLDLPSELSVESPSILMN